MPNAGSSHYGMLRLPDSDVWGCSRACENRDGLMCPLWPPRSCPPLPSIPGPFCCLSSGKSLQQPQSDCVVPDPPKADYFCCTICKSCLCIYKSPLFPITSSSSPFPPPSPIPAFLPHPSRKIKEQRAVTWKRNKQTNRQKKGESQARQGDVSPIATRSFN